ncbi:hypothetical protein GGR52DRAFT_584226 [Hypoxylon sp. FL1284]|nr:hypothetical protein GGR52DRAFT_584226 [Hypoxylon sp. FL1284]
MSTSPPPPPPDAEYDAPPSPGAEYDPPPYAAGGSSTTRRNDAEDVVQPVILIHAGQYVRARTAGGAALYQLSRDVRRSATSESQLAQVTLERLVHVVRGGGRAPQQRARAVFELTHTPSVLATGFPYSLEPASRSALGRLALRGPAGASALALPGTDAAAGLRVVRIRPEAARPRRDDQFPKGYRARRGSLFREAELVFDVARTRGRYEWRGADGARLAVEDLTDDGELARLVLLAPVTRRVLDAMVASWCLRMWRASIRSDHSPLSALKEVRSNREILPRWW